MVLRITIILPQYFFLNSLFRTDIHTRIGTTHHEMMRVHWF